MLKWYIAIIREQTEREVNALPISRRAVIQKEHEIEDGYFGYLWYFNNWPVGPEFDNLTLAGAAMLETQVIENIISHAFPRVHEN